MKRRNKRRKHSGDNLESVFEECMALEIIAQCGGFEVYVETTAVDAAGRKTGVFKTQRLCDDLVSLGVSVNTVKRIIHSLSAALRSAGCDC